MKAEGYRRVTLRGLPSSADRRMAGMGFRQVPAWENQQEKAGPKSRAAKVKFAVQIRETSLHAAARLPQVQKALKNAAYEFLSSLGEFPEKDAVIMTFLNWPGCWAILGVKIRGFDFSIFLCDIINTCG